MPFGILLRDNESEIIPTFLYYVRFLKTKRKLEARAEKGTLFICDVGRLVPCVQC